VRRRFLIGLAGLIALMLVLSLALARVRSVQSGPARTPTPSCLPNCPVSPLGVPVFPTSPGELVPDKVTDLSPGVALYYKTAIFVEHPDGTLEVFYLVPEIFQEFVQGLPAADKVVSVFYPQSMMGPGSVPPTTPPSP